MRVLHTIDSLAPEKGGTSRSVPRLAKALDVPPAVYELFELTHLTGVLDVRQAA